MWAKFAAEGWAHPKVLKVGNAAYGAFVRAVQWSSEHLTEGRIPDDVALLIAPRKAWQKLVDARVSEGGAGLAERIEGGYQIHDYLAWNPSAAQVRTKRDADRRRQENARQKRELSRRDTGVSHDGRHAVSHSAPSPSPSPSPSQRAETSQPSSTKLLQKPSEACEPTVHARAMRVDTESLVEPALANPSPPDAPPVPIRPKDDLLRVLQDAAKDGHPWCVQALARAGERGYLLTSTERQRLREIRTEREAAAAPQPVGTGPPRRNGYRNLDLIPVAEGGRSTLQALQPGDFDWKVEELKYENRF